MTVRLEPVSPGEGGARLLRATDYDRAGRETRIVEYDPGGRPSFTLVFRYGEGGRLVEKTRTQGGEKKVWRYRYALDHRGRVAEMLETSAGAAERHAYQYTGDGGREERVYSGDDLVRHRVFDAAGRLLRDVNWASGVTTDNAYDDRGNLSLSESRRPARPSSRVEYHNRYDEAGRLITVQVGGRTRQLTYDGRGRIGEERQLDEKGRLERALRYAYETW
jgi:YD repeat-containing protein